MSYATAAIATFANVLGTLDRLVGKAESHEKGEALLAARLAPDTSCADARTRIAAAQALVAATDPAAWPASGDMGECDLPNGMGFIMKAHEYCRDWAVPQAYFHLMSAYSILRMEGVAIGKIDYVGYMLQYAKKPAA